MFISSQDTFDCKSFVAKMTGERLGFGNVFPTERGAEAEVGAELGSVAGFVGKGVVEALSDIGVGSIRGAVVVGSDFGGITVFGRRGGLEPSVLVGQTRPLVLVQARTGVLYQVCYPVDIY